MAHPFSLDWLFGRQQGPAVLPEPVALPEPVVDVAPGPEVESRSYALSDHKFWSYFSMGRSSLAKVDVTQRTSLGTAPFFCAVRFIAEGVAMLDRKVKQYVGNGTQDSIGHPIWKLMNRRPHAYYTWNDLLSAFLVNACLGNGYIRIHWNYKTMRPMWLEHIPSIYVHPEFDDAGNLWFLVSGSLNGRTVIERLPHTDVLHLKGLSLDGVLGFDMTELHQATFGTSIARGQYSEAVLGNGARPSLAIKSQESLTEQEVAAIEENVMRRIGGTENAGRPLVLDAGQDVQYLQWSPLEAALDKLASLNVEDVVRLTKVPRDFMGLDNHGTYGAGVQRSQDLLTHCYSPWIEKIQEEFNSKLFFHTEVESGSVFFEFDTSMYTSMDKVKETELLVQQVRGTIRTPNEARAVLGLDPIDGGDELFGDINFIPIKDISRIAFAKYLSAAGEKSLGEGSADTENLLAGSANDKPEKDGTED